MARIPKAKSETEQPEEQTPPDEPEDLNALPPGLGFGEGDEEPENLEDLDEPLEDEEEPEEEPEELTPEQIRALRQEIDTANALLGRQGEELGRWRQQAQQPSGQPGRGFGYPQGQQAGQAADPAALYRQQLKAATDQFVQTGDTEGFANTLAQLNIGLVGAAGQYFEGRLTEREAQSKAEVDFLAKNADLVDGTPRSIFEGELAKLKLGEPRSPVTELRQRAADETRRQLSEWGWRQQDEDRRARGEANKLRGPAGRRSRTGSQPGGTAASMQQSRQTYIDTHRQRQSRS